MNLRIPQDINASTKNNQLPPKIMVNRDLRSEFPRSRPWLTALSLHSQFHRIWSILVDTDHSQACLFIPEFRQGSEDTLFFDWQSFCFHFQDVPVNSERTYPGHLVFPLPRLLFLGYFCSCPRWTTAYFLLLLLKSDSGFCFHVFVFPWPNKLRV